MSSIKMLRFKRFTKTIVCSSILLTLGACQSGNSGSGQNPNGTGSDVTGNSSLTEQVDSSLKDLYPSADIQSPAMKREYDTMWLACREATGTFDYQSEECTCLNGGLFTTAGIIPMCAQMTVDRLSTNLILNTGFYRRDGSDQMMMVTDSSTLDSQASEDLDRLMTPRYTEVGPFRLSMYGYANFLVQVDHKNPSLGIEKFLQSGSKTADLYSIIQGQPFSVYKDTYPLYEPNSRFVMAALGVGLGLSRDDQAEFAQIGVSTMVAEADQPVAQALIDAYKIIPTIQYYKPDHVSSPYKSGCASYCVSSAPLGLSSSDYIATYKKVYQFGTPSARLIVLQKKGSKEIVGVVSLNVAETISTITLVNRQANSTLYSYRTFDRNWRALYGRDEKAEDTRGVDSFDQLLKEGD